MVGEHIRILKQGRWVHAVDCGDGTILLLAEEAEPPRVRRAYRPEFAAGAAAVEIVTHRERTFPAKEIVKRAYSRASDPALAAMFRDSEAFVEWCTTGRLSGPRGVAPEAPASQLAPAPPKPAAEPRPAAPRKPAGKPAARATPRTAGGSKAARAKPRAKAKARPAPRAKRAKAKAAARRSPPGAARRKVAKAKPARRASKPARKGKR